MSNKNPKTLANWRSQGRYRDLEYVRIGRFIRYHLGSLNNFRLQQTLNGIDISTKQKDTK